MKRKRWIGIIMIVAALVIMLLPESEADAAASASDFVIVGETLKSYKGKEKVITVPDSVKIIGEGAFQENTAVEKITIPDSVKQIEAYAFWGCDNLKTVVLGKGLTEVGDMAFNNCTGLEYITIPDNIRRIGIQSFAYCTRLEDITIPTKVTDIREDAFDGDYLLNIHCEVGSYADKYAQAFYERQKEMPVYEEPNTGNAPDVSGSSGSVGGSGNTDSTDNSYSAVLGDLLGSTHVVGNQAVLIGQGSGFKVIGGDSEGKEESGGSPAVGGASDPGLAVGDPSVTVPERAYYRNGALTEAKVEEGIIEIAPFAYARSGLTDLTLPQGLEKIDYAAFYHCDDLRRVELPDSVTEVAPKAFAHTAWVRDFLADADSADEEPFLISGGVLVAYRGNGEEVTVPEGVRVIAGEAFEGHTELKKIFLPKSLQDIGERAFAGCNLESVEYEGTGMDRDILEERVTMTDMSAPPVHESGFRWTWCLAVVLFLTGSICLLGRQQKL